MIAVEILKFGVIKIKDMCISIQILENLYQRKQKTGVIKKLINQLTSYYIT